MHLHSFQGTRLKPRRQVKDSMGHVEFCSTTGNKGLINSKKVNSVGILSVSKKQTETLKVGRGLD